MSAHNICAYCKWNTFLQSQWIIRWGEKNADKNNNKNGINNKILRLQYTKINLPAVVIALLLILADPWPSTTTTTARSLILSSSVHAAATVAVAAVLVVVIFFTCRTHWLLRSLLGHFTYSRAHYGHKSKRARDRTSERMTETYTFRYATTIREHIKPIKV